MPQAALLQTPSTADHSASLDTSREPSTIPRTGTGTDTDTDGPEQTGHWLYPSPRMFYNALKRKGHETAPGDIQAMVAVHNWLNEAVWAEVLHWEALHRSACPAPTLKRFMGRPQELSPKALLYTRLYRGPPPFDRHDWTVDRCGREVRYVIDYYSAGTDASGMPVFSVDVRPALDSLGALVDRVRMAWRPFCAP
jgi:cytochrome c heme-lyase